MTRGWTKGMLLLNALALAISAMQTASLVESCGQTLQGDGMVLTSHGDSRRYYFVAPGTDCQLTLRAASSRDRVLFCWRFFLVYNLQQPSPTPRLSTAAHLPETPGPCASSSHVQLYDGQGSTASPLGRPLCGKDIPRPILSSGRSLTLRLVTRGQQPRVDFVGDFTSLRTGLNASTCSAQAYFPCDNGRCIPHSLVCDGQRVDNCGDATDESLALCKDRSGLGSPVLLPSLQAETPPVPTLLPNQVTCAGPPEPPGQAETSRILLALLASLLGAAMLLWCCWNPGWLFWRVGGFRHLRGCNSICAACHLCARSCAHRETPRVTPHNAAEPPV